MRILTILILTLSLPVTSLALNSEQQDAVAQKTRQIADKAADKASEAKQAATDLKKQVEEKAEDVKENLSEEAAPKSKKKPAEESIEIGDARVSKTFHSKGNNLVLNGAGTRTKFFMDIYVAALYLKKPSTDADAVIKADEPMAIRLHIVSSMINSERMSDSTRDGFVRSTNGNIAPIEDDIDELITAFADAVEDGDVFDLVYLPGDGVTVYRNGEAKSNVKGLNFKQALFGIWLSDDPVQSHLKRKMINSDD